MATSDDAAQAIRDVIYGNDGTVGAFLGTLAIIDPDAVMAVMQDPLFMRLRAYINRHPSTPPEDAA